MPVWWRINGTDYLAHYRKAHQKLMYRQLTTFFDQPYPFIHCGKLLLRNTVLVLCIAFCFDFFFEPYNVYRPEHRWPYAVIVLAHALNGSFQYLMYGFLLSKLVSRDDWKLYKEFTFLGYLLISIGVGSFLIRDLIYDNPENGQLRYLIEEVRNTVLTGSLILFFMTYINFRVLKSQHQAGAEKLATQPPQQDRTLVTLDTPLHSEELTFLIDELVLAKAEGNYVRFYLKKADQVEEQFIRISLASVSQQLCKFQQVIRTHRAFLYNINHLGKVEGNAQGYFLSTEILDFQVPVSRSQLARFDEKLAANINAVV